MFTTLVTRPEPSTTRQMETKAASASCRSRTAIAWVVLFVSQMHEMSAFSSLGLIRNARALPVSPGSQSKVVDSGRTRIFRSVDVSGCRNMGQQDSSNKVRWLWVRFHYSSVFGSCNELRVIPRWICNQKHSPRSQLTLALISYWGTAPNLFLCACVVRCI